MIGRLRGILIEKNPPQAVIDINGVGYEVNVSMQTSYCLPAAGGTVQLYTWLVVCENAHLLFGFATVDERTTFHQLVKVSGIGVKTALGVLSAMSADELAQAVTEEDVEHLFSTPGIGKKTVERMAPELCGKLVSAVSGDPAALFTAANGTDSVVSTLLTLGYNEREVRAAMEGLPKGMGAGGGVRLALKNLLKQTRAV